MGFPRLGKKRSDRYVDEYLAMLERQGSIPPEQIKTTEALRQQAEDQEGRRGQPTEYQMPQEFTPEQTRWTIGMAVAAGLVAAVIMILVLFLFLLFCVKVWFA